MRSAAQATEAWRPCPRAARRGQARRLFLLEGDASEAVLALEVAFSEGQRRNPFP